jgi:hypothetical protein
MEEGVQGRRRGRRRKNGRGRRRGNARENFFIKKKKEWKRERE